MTTHPFLIRITIEADHGHIIGRDPRTITEAALRAECDDTLLVYGELLGQPGEVEVQLGIQYEDYIEDDDYGRSFINRIVVALGGYWFGDDGAMIGPYTRDGLRDLFGDAVVQRWQDMAVL